MEKTYSERDKVDMRAHTHTQDFWSFDLQMQTSLPFDAYVSIHFAIFYHPSFPTATVITVQILNYANAVKWK